VNTLPLKAELVFGLLLKMMLFGYLCVQMKLQIQAVFRYLNSQSKKQNAAAIRLCFFVIDNYHRPQNYRPEL